jgi:hypothetical protein
MARIPQDSSDKSFLIIPQFIQLEPSNWITVFENRDTPNKVMLPT